MSYIARTNRHRIGRFEVDAGLTVYDSSAVFGIGVSWQFHRDGLWSVMSELSLGPLVTWFRLSHYRRTTG